MLEALDIHNGHRVLEIGTGYNAALLTHRFGDHTVCSVDIDPTLIAAAGQRLDHLEHRHGPRWSRRSSARGSRREILDGEHHRRCRQRVVVSDRPIGRPSAIGHGAITRSTAWIRRGGGFPHNQR
ncbi:MAG: hypothetical protein ACRDTD_21150 [Pseudonocardiaceae bacterium]